MPKYILRQPVKANGRIIKPDPDGGPVELTEKEAKIAQDYLVEAEDSPAKTKKSDSSGKGKDDDPASKGAGESSQNTRREEGKEPSGKAPAGGEPDDKNPGPSEPEGNGAAPKGEGPVDLNAATKDQLVAIGLSDKAAGAVIGYRKKLAKNRKRFESLDELTEVHGLGDKALAKVRDRLTVTEA